MSASREALLQRYAQLIRKWNPAINLVAPSSLQKLEERHIADSLQLADLSSDSMRDWLDIGSGGGLPGIVVAIARPDLEVRLVDSDHRKVAFLHTVIRELQLTNCTAVASRIEQLAPAQAQNLSARALAPVVKLVPFLDRHLAIDGTAWLMKGRNWQAELTAVNLGEAYEVTVHSSRTDPDAAILQLRKRHG